MLGCATKGVLTYVGTKVMLFRESILIVIEMACTAKQQTITQMEALELVESEDIVIKEQIDIEAEKARDYRKHLAQEKALRQLERRKAHALAAVHMMSFIR